MNRNVLTYFFACLFFLYYQLTCKGQEHQFGFDPRYSIGDLILDQWTNEEGLLSSNLTSINQSKRGFIWTTSHNGLQRFDGANFRNFTTENVPFLSSDSFYRVFESDTDTLWFTTERSGIVGINRGVVFPFEKNDSIPRAIITVFVSSSGDFWIGSKNKGLYRMDKKGNIEFYQKIPEVTINHIQEDSKGNLLVATDGSGLYVIEGDETTNYSTKVGLSSNIINHIDFDNAGNILLATIEGVNRIRSGKVEIIPNLEILDVNQIAMDSFGTLWMATEQGIARWNEELNIYEVYAEENGLPAPQVSGLCFDTEGSLWLSTKKAGIVRFKRGRITTLSKSDGLSSDKVNIVSKKDDKLFIGTDNGEINVFHKGSINQLICDAPFQDAGIRDFLFDTDQNDWVVNYNGILKMVGNKKLVINDDSGLPSSEIRRIFQDSKNRIWMGSRTGGLILFDPNLDFKIYNKTNGLGSDYILSIEEDFQGNILIGTNAGGFSLLDPAGSLTTYHYKDDDSGFLIFNIHVLADMEYLLSTNIGIFHFKNGNFTELSLGKSMDAKAIFDIIDDKKGSFWLTSSLGILRISKEEVAGYIEGGSNIISYELFDDNEGMLNNECTGATRSFFDHENGKIYVPTFQGVAIVDPYVDLTNSRIPEVYVTGLKIDDEQFNVDDEDLRIKPGAFRYTFDFTSLSYLSPSKVKFKYKLEGIDKNWIGPVSDRSVEYTNLPYGEYTFKVKATNNSQIWNEDGASLSFFVLPYFYQTMWFILSCIIVILLTLWLIYKWRIKEITERNFALAKINTELDRFVYSASHDLRAPLASTLGLVNIARLENSLDKKDHYINLIEECVHKMDQFISDIIDFSRNKNKEVDLVQFDIKELINEIFSELKFIQNSVDIKKDIQLVGGDDVYGDKLRFKIIMANLIANSIAYSKHNSDSYIKVEVNQSGRNIIINVEDNGIGIADRQLQKVFDMFYRANEKSKGSGLGLYIVKETVDKLNGKIELESKENIGTKITIEVPKFS